MLFPYSLKPPAPNLISLTSVFLSRSFSGWSPFGPQRPQLSPSSGLLPLALLPPGPRGAAAPAAPPDGCLPGPGEAASDGPQGEPVGAPTATNAKWVGGENGFCPTLAAAPSGQRGGSRLGLLYCSRSGDGGGREYSQSHPSPEPAALGEGPSNPRPARPNFLPRRRDQGSAFPVVSLHPAPPPRPQTQHSLPKGPLQRARSSPSKAPALLQSSDLR